MKTIEAPTPKQAKLQAEIDAEASVRSRHEQRHDLDSVRQGEKMASRASKSIFVLMDEIGL